METYRDYFDTVAFALNDDEPGHEYSRYPLKLMVASFNEAMALAAKHRIDLFTEAVVMRLQPGTTQDARGCGCGNVLDVLAQTDTSGSNIKNLTGSRKTTTTVKRNWKKPSCIRRPESDSGYVIDYADIDDNLNGRFTVYPPVPQDAEVFARVKCAMAPCPISEADTGSPIKVQGDLRAAAWHYVLAKMLTGDRYSQSAVNQAQYHYQMFFNILGVMQQQETRIESPEEA